jgi:hypothetical protein
VDAGRSAAWARQSELNSLLLTHTKYMIHINNSRHFAMHLHDTEYMNQQGHIHLMHVCFPDTNVKEDEFFFLLGRT